MAQPSQFSRPRSLLVTPKNRIAYFKEPSTFRLTLEEDNLKCVVAQVLENNSELETLPVQIISVLEDKAQKHLRDLHTDWLVEFIINCGNVDQSVEQWSCRQKGENNAVHSNTYVPMPGQNSSWEEEKGVYIWPSPLIVTDCESCKRTLLWIIYANLPDERKEDDDLLDEFTKLISSKVVLLKTSNKDLLVDRVKVVDADKLSNIDFLEVQVTNQQGSFETDSMRSFLEKIREHCLKHKDFQRTDSTCAGTLENLGKFMDDLKEKINNFIDMEKANQQEAKKKSTQTSMQAEVHSMTNESTSTINREEVQIPLCTDAKSACTLTTCAEMVTKISVAMDIWIQRDLTLQNAHTLKERVMTSLANSLGDSLKWLGIIEDKEIMQNQINSMHSNFKNMYDNYVCFEGKIDQDQMLRFSATCYQHCDNSWKTKTIRHPNHFTLAQIKDAYKRLHFLFQTDNSSITGHENELMQNVCANIVAVYNDKLKLYVEQKQDDEFDDWQVELVNLNKKLQSYCIVMVGRALDYGGKLNNVVRNHIEILKTSFSKIFNDRVKELKQRGNYIRELPQHYDMYASCTSRIQQIFQARVNNNQFYPDILKQEHDIVVQNATVGMDMTETRELRLKLDTFFANMFENEVIRFESRIIQGRQFPYDAITFYITNEFIYTYCTRQIGGTQPFTWKTSQSFNPNDFGHMQAEVGIAHENSVWFGYFLNNMHAYDKKYKFKHLHKFLDYFDLPDITPQILKLVILTIFAHLRDGIVSCCQQKFHRLNIITASWLTCEQRLLVRQACKDLGFQYVFILSESPISAWQYFNAPKSDSRETLLLVVIARKTGVRMEIYGKHDRASVGGAHAVMLLAISDEHWTGINNQPSSSSLTETVKATYGRVLSQLPRCQRKKVTSYVSILDFQEWNLILDSLLQNSEKLIKEERITNNALSAILYHFANNENHLLDVFLGLATPTNFQDNKADNKRLEKSEEPQPQLVTEASKAFYDKCERMERQIADGTVKVGPLRKKIILSTIQRGKISAEENLLGQEEEDEIEELVKLYHFQT